jgi:glycosyltransferase involved in cell wall biosynthesis
MTKKILIVTQNFYPAIGSAGNRMKNIFQLLTNAGFDVEVLTIEPSYPNKNMYKDRMFWDEEDINNSSNKITRVQIKSRKFTNKLVSRLFFYLEMMYRYLIELWGCKKKEYDYIYVSTPPIFIVFSAWLMRRRLKAKLILEVRDLWPDSLTGVKSFDNKLIIKLFQFIEKKMYQMADAIVINSIGFQSHIESKLNKPKEMVYLPNGPRHAEIIKNEMREEFRVIYAGNLGLAQDIDRLKEVAKEFDKHEIQFDVLGYGMKTKEFTQFLEDNHLTNVTIHKPTTRKNSLSLIRKSHVSIAFLNDVEVFQTVLPGKIIDYMTCKTPIVAGVKGVAADLITSNHTGFAFSSNDTQQLIEKVIELKNDPSQLETMQQNCEKTVREYFLWEHNIQRLVDIIK